MAAGSLRLRQMNYVETEVRCHIVYDVGAYALNLPCVGSDQGIFANCVDQAGEAARVAIYSRNGLLRKDRVGLRAD